MKSSVRYKAEVIMPKRFSGFQALVATLIQEYAVPVVVKQEEGEEPFLQGRLRTFSFRQFTRLPEGGLRVRGEITVITGRREKIPIKGEFNLNGEGWIERDRGRDP